MMHWAGLPREFWCYAYIYAARIRNLVPTRANDGFAPPQKLFLADQQDHCSPPVPPPTWGCLAYVHIPKEQQKSKLDVRATPAVYLGWSRGRKAGKYFSQSQGKMLYSRSATHMLNTPGWSATHGIPDQETSPTSENASVEEEDGESEGEDPIGSSCEVDDEPHAPVSGRRSARLRTVPRVNYEEPPAPAIPGVILANATSSEDNLDQYEHLYKHKSEEDMSWREVMKLPDAHIWKAAVRRELQELHKLNAFTVARLPTGRKAVKHKWVFRRKRLANGKVERYKARIVAKGYTQVRGVDYHEVFASVIRPESVKLLLAIAQSKGLNVYQLDIGNAFLNAKLQEEVYLTIPEGFDMLVQDGVFPEPQPGAVWLLLACLPGLHQSGREWQLEKGSTLLQAGFARSVYDPNVYFDETLTKYIGVYTDDDLVICPGDGAYNDIVTLLRTKYRVSDLGVVNYFLGVEFHCSHEGIKLTQTKYVARLLDDEGFGECSIAKTPMVTGLCPQDVATSAPLDEHTKYRSLVGALLYVARWTRPDIAFAVSFCGRFCNKPTVLAMKAVKHILRYLKGTLSSGIYYPRDTTCTLHAYCDSDYANDASDRKSVSGYVFFLGTCIISWESKKQQVLATSTTEAEYISLFVASQEAMFLRGIVGELLNDAPQVALIRCDNNGALALAKNPVFHKRSKHIDVKYHAIRERVNNHCIQIARVDSGDNIADCLTKPLDGTSFRRHASTMIVP